MFYMLIPVDFYHMWDIYTFKAENKCRRLQKNYTIN